MMVVIEYLNVLTSGGWQAKLTNSQWGQYLLAGMLGVLPGCLGPFMVVTMYSHGMFSLGAVVTAMIATSGDEAYVMLALFPGKAAFIMALLFATGLVVGWVTDAINRRYNIVQLETHHGMEVHVDEACQCFPQKDIWKQWRECTPFRATLCMALVFAAIALIAGRFGPPEWNWVRITLVAVVLLAIFIGATVPDHFLEEHLWQHVMVSHVPRIFIWTFGTLVGMHLLIAGLHLDTVIRESSWIILLIAALVGLIPESGPHLVFVSMYAEGLIPFSVLLTSSIVQDGHGMLPMLAHSRQAFLSIKLINLAVGLLIGLSVYLAGS
jgi:hypothetical protein